MKIRILIALALLLLVLINPSSSEAHPGRTASDGCHYCRTNCDSWGVPWNERHCHNGGSSSNGTGTNTLPIAEKTVQNVLPATTVPSILPTRIPSPTKKPYVETDMDKKKFFRVISIIDGDTIALSIRGNIERVRLLAIDTPETVDPRKPVQCFGREATNKMQQLVSGKFVKIVDDRTQGNRDKYSRLLRYVYLENGTFVNAEMVKQGYAFSYKEYPTKYQKDFNNLEKQAREKNLGLWNVCK